MIKETKVTKKGAILNSLVVGKNPFRKSEWLSVVVKKECISANYNGGYTVELVTTQRVGNDMDWSKSSGHWTGTQLAIIESMGGTITKWGHIYFKRKYSSFGDTSSDFKKMVQLALKLVKTPSVLL
jgi:hypothetical protein